AETNLVTTVTQQHLTVLQARDNAEVARQQLQHDEEFQKLAQARYDVGRASLIDVRQAQVARGQAEVVLLRARTAVQVEKLRLFQQLGVTAPVDLAAVQLTDTFTVQAPTWQLNDLLTMAEQQNPALKALREREHAAAWGVRAATASYGPSLSLSAGWSGFTQKLSDINPTIAGARASAAADSTTCAYANSMWLNSGSGPPLDCSPYSFTPAAEQLQLATERYRVGSGTFFELLDAQVAALRAETDYVNAVYDYHKALAALEAAVGRPLR